MMNQGGVTDTKTTLDPKNSLEHHTVDPSHAQTPSTAPSSWRPESGFSELPSVQPSAPINNVHEGYWKQGGQGFQNYTVSSMQSSFQNPLDLNSVSGSFQSRQKPKVPQQPSVPYATSHQVAGTYHPSLSPPPQTAAPPPQTAAPPFVSARVSNVQIPTNPRISSNLPVSLPKNNNATTGVTKSAYVSVSLPKTNENTSSHAVADSSLKSLRGYVERALAHCKDDRQMSACEDILKEVITKASIDGTLSTRDWDTEPLFPLPNTDMINNDSTTPSSQMKKETNKADLRPAKRQHVGDGRIGLNNGDSSSESHKEQSLTAYYTTGK